MVISCTNDYWLENRASPSQLAGPRSALTHEHGPEQSIQAKET